MRARRRLYRASAESSAAVSTAVAASAEPSSAEPTSSESSAEPASAEPAAFAVASAFASVSTYASPASVPLESTNWRLTFGFGKPPLASNQTQGGSKIGS